MVFDDKSFWKFTTALGRKLTGGRPFFTKLFLTVHQTGTLRLLPLASSHSDGVR